MSIVRRVEDTALGKQALTHRSWVAERGGRDNERLEFLGDAVLELVMTDLMFTNHPNLNEGDMAQLRAGVVRTESLAMMAREIKLGEHVRLGRGERIAGGADKDSILADAFEAVIGACYLVHGLEECKKQLIRLLTKRIHEVMAGPTTEAKTRLQEKTMAALGVMPIYSTHGHGPDHDRHFDAVVYVGGERMGRGEGRSKKLAEAAAAMAALEKMA